MIKINPFYELRCAIYKDGNYFDEITNEYELNDLRIQIAKEKAIGFQVEFEEDRIDILPDGTLSKWPNGFYDTATSQLAELFKVQRGIK